MKLSVSGLFIIISIIFPVFLCYANDKPETVNERIDFLFGKGEALRYEPFIRAFQDAVRQNDPVKVSHFIKYPLNVTRYNHDIKLRSAKDVIKYYPQIFTREMRETIINQDYEALFVNWQGVMFGNGAVWISKINLNPKSNETVLKVTTIHMEGIEKK